MAEGFKSERFKLIVTIGLILLQEDKVLLLRRSGTGWRDGHYGLVGGCVDGNESVTQAIIREAYEEANIILQPESLEMVSVMHSNIAARTSFETVDFFFVSRQWQGTLKNNEPLKHDLLEFFPLDELPEPLMEHAKIGIHNAMHAISFTEYGW